MAERILITQLGFLGDVILSTPVISAVRRHFPEAELSFLTTRSAVPLVKYHPDLHAVIEYDKYGDDRGLRGFFRLRSELERYKFSRVFSLHRSARTALLHWSANIPLRFGFIESRFSFLYNKTVPRVKTEHDVVRNLSILQAADIVPDLSLDELRIEVPAETIGEMKSKLPSGRYVIVAPGSVWRTKRWTVAGFAAVVRLLRERGYSSVLIGGKDDAHLASAIERLADAPVINFVGKLGLLESAAAIRQADVVISNDSAPLHLASAFKRPTVALFCATVPEFGFGPWQNRSSIVEVSGLPCRPCGRHGKFHCPTGTHACQIGITPAAVLSAFDAVSV